MDRSTGQVIRRCGRANPGNLVSIDIKKLGRIPDGGGCRANGSETNHGGKPCVGYAVIDAAVDNHTRLAVAEVHADDKAVTTAGFVQRATSFFAEHGIEVSQVLTDKDACSRSFVFRDTLGGIEHPRMRPYRAQTNGKVERFHRTLLEEWAYVRPYRSESERTAAFDEWLHLYNHHRHHTAIGCSPIERANNLSDHYL
jgi:transposase InsO family protein